MFARIRGIAAPLCFLVSASAHAALTCDDVKAALGQARFLLRLPADWNGRLVVAGASGTRSEYNGDFAWSDYVLQEGYAYASQNKGVLNLRLVGVFLTPPPTDPLACRLAPPPVS